jgi:hypothetical protein
VPVPSQEYERSCICDFWKDSKLTLYHFFI